MSKEQQKKKVHMKPGHKKQNSKVFGVLVPLLTFSRALIGWSLGLASFGFT